MAVKSCRSRSKIAKYTLLSITDIAQWVRDARSESTPPPEHGSGCVGFVVLARGDVVVVVVKMMFLLLVVCDVVAVGGGV